MKTNIAVIAVMAALAIVGCNSNKHHDHSAHEHGTAEVHDGHDHAAHNHDGHNHSTHDHGTAEVHDGHNHAAHEHGTTEVHDGHNHDGHNHSAHDHSAHNHGTAEVHDGHNHDGHEHAAEAHANEIRFTHEQAHEIGLETETVKSAPFAFVIRTGGHIQALPGEDRTVVATSSGVVSFANPSIAVGMNVNAGQKLASVSAETLQDGDPVLKAKLAYETAEKEFLRAEKLVRDQIISQKEFEQVRMGYETAKAAYQGHAKNFSEKGVAVTAPMNGYITEMLVADGEYVTAGQPIMGVSRNNKLQLRADVPETYFRYIKDIRTANFKPSYEDRTYELSELNGRLVSYGKSASGASSYIPVTFEFNNTGDFVAGAFAEVYLQAKPKENAVSLPLTALTEEQGLYFVYLEVHHEAYKKQEVTLGQRDGIRVEILSGLKEGDVVVTKGAYQVKLASASAAIPAHSHNH